MKVFQPEFNFDPSSDDQIKRFKSKNRLIENCSIKNWLESSDLPVCSLRLVFLHHANPAKPFAHPLIPPCESGPNNRVNCRQRWIFEPIWTDDEWKILKNSSPTHPTDSSLSFEHTQNFSRLFDWLSDEHTKKEEKFDLNSCSCSFHLIKYLYENWNWKRTSETSTAAARMSTSVRWGRATFERWKLKIFFSVPYLVNGRMAKRREWERVENAFQFNFHHSDALNGSTVFKSWSHIQFERMKKKKKLKNRQRASHPISENIFNPFISQSSLLNS